MVETKEVYVKKFGYERIVKNFQKFGWTVNDIIEEITTTTERSYEGEIKDNKVYLKENVKTSSKVLINISMYRDTEDFVNLKSIKLLELVFNIFYLIRKLIAWILPLFSGVMLLVALTGNSDLLFEAAEDELSIGGIWSLVLFSWLGLILIENLLASIAGKCLIYK